MKILNLYSGLGGNRKLWGDEHKVTAVELDPANAAFYSDKFPNDTVIVGDAHNYLVENYHKFDFIWGSPPCPTHSRARFWSSKPNNKVKPVYPDMKLYQEIVFLDNYYEGKWVIENVDPFYTPLIMPSVKMGRHLFWSNFKIPSKKFEDADIKNGKRKDWQDLHGFNITGYKFNQRRDKILRNCVNPLLGKYILDRALGIISHNITNQYQLF